MLIQGKRGWELDEREATPEGVYRNRRAFLRQAGMAGIGAIAAGCAAASEQPAGLRGEAAIEAATKRHPKIYPAKRNEAFELDRPLTAEDDATSYVNFYEFLNNKEYVSIYSRELTLRPWTVEVSGLVEKPFTMDVDAILDRFGAEERLYRHRCVEAWAMAVPWTGIPMRKFVEACKPLSSATHVRFFSFHRPQEAIGQRDDMVYPWPYYEGLRLDEATNDLAMIVTGMYGKPLQPQNGAPIRTVLPWKYGYKSAKSIVRIEFVDSRPPTFWNALQPREYGFISNVNPEVPHPRWSQATERILGTGERRPTQLFNGYADWVADLYA